MRTLMLLPHREQGDTATIHEKSSVSISVFIPVSPFGAVSHTASILGPCQWFGAHSMTAQTYFLSWPSLKLQQCAQPEWTWKGREIHATEPRGNSWKHSVHFTEVLLKGALLFTAAILIMSHLGFPPFVTHSPASSPHLPEITSQMNSLPWILVLVWFDVKSKLRHSSLHLCEPNFHITSRDGTGSCIQPMKSKPEPTYMDAELHGQETLELGFSKLWV
jgi:hypothetical protein